MARNLSAVVAGHICLDIIPQIGGSAAEFRSSFQPGHLAVVGPALFGTGGAASNTGLAMHRLGVDVRIMGKVGDDFIGEMIRQILVPNGRGPAAGMIIDQSVQLILHGRDQPARHRPHLPPLPRRQRHILG